MGNIHFKCFLFILTRLIFTFSTEPIDSLSAAMTSTSQKVTYIQIIKLIYPNWSLLVCPGPKVG